MNYNGTDITNASEHLLFVTKEMADDMMQNILADLPWPRTPYVPPTRWQRIKRLPYRAKVAVMSAIHDRYLREYCDYDY